jgi:glycosyltransferase involved in cell wall biosynthesis
MNILQVITPSKIAGAERSTTSLCEHLQASGHRVVIGCKQGSPLVPVMRDAGLDVRPLPISGKLNLRGPSLLVALARETGAAVIHGQLSTASWHAAFAGRLAGLPTIAHVRALNRPFWYRWTTRVIAVSHAVKEHLVQRGMDGAKIDVVYNGVDPARYYLPCTREDARARLGLPACGSLIGIIAHLTAKKGHAVFLEAFATLAARHPDARALFLGEGSEREALEAQAKRLGLAGRVIFAGWLPDVLPYYAAMDLVVLPSIAGEGLPRALLEAGMLRRASIGTRLSGTPEIVRDGETGFIVPVGDVGALVERLDALLADAALRDRMGEAAHEYVSATFTVRAMVEGTLATYRKAGACG